MSFRFICLIFFAALLQLQANAQDVVITGMPDTLKNSPAAVNKLAYSEIDIPVRIALKPLYAYADKLVDTLYTSPDYPNGWVNDGCTVRYQYRFVRGPFNMRAVNNQLLVGFSGYYGLRGSTRLCTGVGNSPWTPACSCGFGSEQPRRIDAAFSVQLGIKNDYSLQAIVNRSPARPVDKCTVCFFGKDVTQTVAKQVDDELGLSITAMQQQLQQFNLRQYFTNIWDSLQTPYPVAGFGALHLQPSQIKLGQLRLFRDTLYFTIGLTAKPELRTDLNAQKKVLPPLQVIRGNNGFRIFIAQQLPYDSLSGFINSQIAGKEYSVGKGLIKKTVRVDSVKLLGGGNKMILQVNVSKAARGSFYLEGIPRYDAIRQVLWLDSLDYHVSSKQVLIKSAAYLLDGLIADKLKSLTRFDLSMQTSSLVKQLTRQLNRNIMPGITSHGLLNKFALNNIVAVPGGLQVEGVAEGKLWIDADAGALLTQFVK